MPQYLFGVMHGDEISWPEGVTFQQVMDDVDAFNKRITDEKRWVFGGGLMPLSASTVVSNENPGGPVITDGPYIETKEYMGGFWILEAADLDDALKLAADASAACHGPIEVRPLQAEPPADPAQA
ncbi:YciI family protein [Spongisporangium articulatum]|uniref:YciI family protein n=1 Tax=Spongisporangium articulatum TaxID=3362603 RepID=A0ABW8AI95_9ACTN